MIRTGLVLLIGSAIPLAAQYAGPAILTRGDVPAAAQQAQIDFRPFLDVSGIFDSGLVGVGTNQNGNLNPQDAYGVEAGFGVYGLHRWRRTTLGLDYRGDYRHYTTKSFFDGTDQSLSLGFSRQLTRHTTLSLKEMAGTFTRSFGLMGFGGMGTFDPTLGYLPANDYFDNSTRFLASEVDFTYQKSARLSFDAGADTFLVRYRSSALNGITGIAAKGDMQYRVTRYSTIGVAYNFSNFKFTKSVGTTDMHSFVGTYSTRLSRNWEFSGYGGTIRYETKFVELVTLDPAIAALLGRSAVAALTHQISYAPSYGGRLVRGFRHSSFSISGSRGVTPGNAIFMTSSMTTGSLGYSFTGMKRWNLGIDASMSDATSQSGIKGSYRSYAAGFGATRQIARATHLTVRFEGRKYDSGTFNNYNRILYRATLGLSFAPGDVPLSLW